MTRAEFIAVARRKGVVQWLESGVIERLSCSRRGHTFATRLNGDHHFVSVQPWYYCRELKPTDFVRAGDIIRPTNDR